jgi:hypothetical protein
MKVRKIENMKWMASLAGLGVLGPLAHLATFCSKKRFGSRQSWLLMQDDSKGKLVLSFKDIAWV